jgi:uncharacterized protein YkwD
MYHVTKPSRRTFSRRGAVIAMPRTACPLIVAVAALATCAAPARAACEDADLQASQATADRVAGALRCVINEERAAVGRQPLAASGHLDRSAAGHSADMVRHGYLAHEREGRPTLAARVRAAGYFDGAATALFSENIGVAAIGGATARVLLDAWMQSPDHRANILHPMFRDIGIGTAFAQPDPAFYPDNAALVVTTDFGQRVMQRKGTKRPRCRARRRPAAAGNGSATTRGRFCVRKRRR